MLWTPQKGIVRVEHNNPTVGSNNLGTSVTTGASASTKGTPAVVFSTTSFDAHEITICALSYGANGTASEGALDILIGAATEEVLIANLLMGYCGGIGEAMKRWRFPLYIPAGSRIAVQAAGARVSTALRVSIILRGWSGLPPHRVGGMVTTYGMGTVPNGTTVVPGASAAEGSWTQIVASTDRDHFALVPSFQPATETAINSVSYMLDLGVGAATEEEVAQSYFYNQSSSETHNGPFPDHPALLDVPSGSRLVMRVSNSGANDTYNGVIHAVS